MLDPSGAICPFCDAAGAWLPLLCTINCTGVTEEASCRRCLPACLHAAASLLALPALAAAATGRCQWASSSHPSTAPIILHPPGTSAAPATAGCSPRLASQVRHSFGLGHEEITALAATEAPGCSGVTFLPYLAGERLPNWPQATGTVLGACVGA